MQALQGAPRIGTALPVVQHGTSSLPREIPLPAVGSWVKLRNLAATLVDGQLLVYYPPLPTALCVYSYASNHRPPTALSCEEVLF